MSLCEFERLDDATVKCLLCGLVVESRQPVEKIRAACKSPGAKEARRRRAEAREVRRREAAALADMPTVARNALARAAEAPRHVDEGQPLATLDQAVELLEVCCRPCPFFSGAGCRHPMKCCEAAEAFVWPDLPCPRDPPAFGADA